jgi:GT2 family glycosyltransferase
MMLTSDLFFRLGGFDEALVTGEDTDLCARARAIGGIIVPRPVLRVIHHGFPVTVSAFLRRERWHGAGDVSSVRRMLESKVVGMTVAFLFVHLVFLYGVARSPQIAAISFGALLVLLLVSVRVKFRTLRGTAILKAMVMFYLYYLGRTLSFVPPKRRGAR